MRYGLAITLLAVACTTNSAETDHIQADACTLAIVTALYGTISDESGQPVTPEKIEASAIEDSWYDCQVMATNGAVEYKCPEGPQPDITINEVPTLSYGLRISAFGAIHTMQVTVVRATNCHVVSQEFKIVVPASE